MFTRAQITALVCLGFTVVSCATSPTSVDQAWSTVPEILSRIVPPTFPKRDFNLVEYGAKAGETNLCTAAFQQAIAACAQAGGGRVVVPAGVFRTGPIHLRSNVELHLSAGSELVFSDRFADYLPPVLVRVGGVELYNYSPLIYARDCTNIAITGTGKLNGNAKAWWAWKSSETRAGFEMGAKGVPVEQRVFGTEAAAIRPSFVSFVSCTNVLMEGFTIGSGPNWTIHPIYCQNVTIRRVNVDTDGPNNDGIDPDSCRDVLIEDCTFSTGDDCVVLKSGYNEDGWRVNRPMENLIMRNCSSKRGHGGLVVGSEMSGSVRNVFMYDCDFDGTDRAIRIKSRIDRGGVVEHIYARDIRAKNMKREFVILNMDYGSDRNRPANAKPPVFRQMHFSNLQGDGAPVAIQITGLPDSPIQDIHFADMNLSATRGVVASRVTGLRFNNVQVTPTKGPVFDFTNATQVAITGTHAPAGTDIFLKLAGTDSHAIRIEDASLSNAKRPFTTEAGVPAGAVQLK
jgi:polygalacturonase